MIWIPLGCTCRPSMELCTKGQFLSFPLDVVASHDFDGLEQCLSEDFAGFLTKANFELRHSRKHHFTNTRYRFDFFHDGDIFAEWDRFVEEYTARIELFRLATISYEVRFIRERGDVCSFRKLVKRYPFAQGTLIRYGEKTGFEFKDEQVRIYSATIEDAYRTDEWGKGNEFWTEILSYYSVFEQTQLAQQSPRQRR